jgi:hypothetical protein
MWRFVFWENFPKSSIHHESWGLFVFLLKIEKNGEFSSKYFKSLPVLPQVVIVFGFAYYQGNLGIVFRFIIEYSS